MIRPYDLYIRFLVTKNYSELDAINSKLEEQALPKITQEEFDPVYDNLFDLVPKPIAALIESQTATKDFMAWMKVLEVHELWEKNPVVYDINYDPDMRTSLRSLLIKRQKHTDICQDLNMKYSYMLKPEHVTIYEKFFWNPARMTRAAWKRYLTQCSNSEKSILFTCLTEPVEKVKLLLNIPSKAEIITTYNKIFAQCEQKIDHYMKQSSKESNYEARQWTDTLMQLGDKIKKYEAGSIEDFGKALQMEFDFVSSDFPTPDENLLKEIEQQSIALSEKNAMV